MHIVYKLEEKWNRSTIRSVHHKQPCMLHAKGNSIRFITGRAKLWRISAGNRLVFYNLIAVPHACTHSHARVCPPQYIQCTRDPLHGTNMLSTSTTVGKNKIIVRTIHFMFRIWIFLTLTLSTPPQSHSHWLHGFTNQPRSLIWFSKETEEGGGEWP